MKLLYIIILSKSNIMCCVRSKSLLSEQNSGTVDSHLNASYGQSYSYSDDAGAASSWIASQRTASIVISPRREEPICTRTTPSSTT